MINTVFVVIIIVRFDANNMMNAYRLETRLSIRLF